MPPWRHSAGFYRPFTGVFTVNFHDDNSSPPEELESLPSFEKGLADEPGNGYDLLEDQKSIELDDSKPENTYIRNYLESCEREFTSFEFKFEMWSESEADVNGERMKVSIPSQNKVYGHWSNDGILFFQGKRQAVNTAIEDLRDKLDRKAFFEEIEFESDFLLWLVYSRIISKDMETGININNIPSGRVSSDETNELIRNKSENPEFILEPILSGGEFVNLHATYEKKDVKFSVDVSKSGILDIDLHPNYADEDIIPHLAPQLAADFIDMYKSWNSLDAEEKYPEPTFFIQIESSLEDDYTSGMNKVVEEYSLKRNQATTHPESPQPETTNTDKLQNPHREEIYKDMTIGDALEIVESEVLESKEKIPGNVDKIAKEVASLANSRGGALILGLTDDGELVGLDNIREADERVAGVIAKSINPPVNVNLKRRSIGDADILIVTVDEAVDTPRSVNGKYYKRVGTTIQELSPEELARMVREKDHVEES